MGMSDKIEAFILELLSDEDDWIELKRNELAGVFDCVPSQINYVISTRFSPASGYITESRRGGGGYLRIRRVKHQNGLYEYISGIGSSIDFATAAALITSLVSSGEITKNDADIIKSAVSDKSLIINQPYKNIIRAEILKNTLLKICERMD